MSCLYFGSGNLATENTCEYSIITGTELANFPLKNIKHDFTTKIARVTGASVAIQIDTGNTSTKNMFCIAGSSVDGLGFTSCSIYGSSTTDFSGAAEIVIPVSQNYKFGYKIFDADTSFRYWKLALTSSGSYCDVSNIYLGESTNLTTNSISNKNFSILNEDKAKVTTNAYSQAFIDTYNKIKKVTGNIDLINKDEYAICENIYNTHGISVPLWMVMDKDNVSLDNAEYIYSGYYFFKTTPMFKKVSPMLWSSDLTLEQGA